MAQTYPLDPVIRRVSSATKVPAKTGKLVIIDTKTGEAIEKKPLFGDVKYYLVANNSEGQNTAECKISGFYLKDFDYSVEVFVRYRAECKEGNEEKVAESLFDRDHPGARLDHLIKSWLAQFCGTDLPLFLHKYFYQPTELQA